TPLEGMPLSRFSCVRTRVKDLMPLKEMQLGYLALNQAGPTDLALLKGMPLKQLYLDSSYSDLSPLEGMPLRTLEFTPKKGMNIEFLGPVKTLESINDKKPAAFWKDYDAQFGTPK